MKLKVIELIEKCMHKFPDDERIYRCMKFFESKGFKKPKKAEEETLLKELKDIRKYFHENYQKSGCRYENFSRKHKAFLDRELNYEFTIQCPTSSSKKGRPKKSFDNKTNRSQHMDILKLAEHAKFNSTLLLRAALLASNRNQNSSRSSKISSILRPPKKTYQPNKVMMQKK